MKHTKLILASAVLILIGSVAMSFIHTAHAQQPFQQPWAIAIEYEDVWVNSKPAGFYIYNVDRSPNAPDIQVGDALAPSLAKIVGHGRIESHTQRPGLNTQIFPATLGGRIIAVSN